MICARSWWYCYELTQKPAGTHCEVIFSSWMFLCCDYSLLFSLVMFRATSLPWWSADAAGSWRHRSAPKFIFPGRWSHAHLPPPPTLVASLFLSVYHAPAARQSLNSSWLHYLFAAHSCVGSCLPAFSSPLSRVMRPVISGVFVLDRLMECM